MEVDEELKGVQKPCSQQDHCKIRGQFERQLSKNSLAVILSATSHLEMYWKVLKNLRLQSLKLDHH